MTAHRFALAALLSATLAACAPSQAPAETPAADASQPPDATQPAAEASPPADVTPPAIDAPVEAAPPVDPETPAAKRAPGQEHAPLLAWRAFGTEPFWNVRVDGDSLLFTTPEDMQGRKLTGTHALKPDGGAHYEGSDGATAFALDIAKGDCNDGMSENEYELVATFRYGDTEYKGCAEAAK